MDTKTVSRLWWSIGLRGALAVVFGLVALFSSHTTLLVLTYIFGAFALINGTVALVTAARAGQAHGRWGLLAFDGLVGIAAGIVSFVWPGITVLVFVYLVAVWAIMTGMAEIAFALQWPNTLPHPWQAALGGALSVLFGILLAVRPPSGERALMVQIGSYAILTGLSLLSYAYRLQALRHGVGSVRGMA